MEESIANAWLQDSTALVRTELTDLVYFAGGSESEAASSLQLSNIDAFTPDSNNPSPLLGATAEHYNSYFGGSYMGLDPSVIPKEESMSQALEQLLICKDDTDNQSTVWVEDHLATEEPLHQLPGWITEPADESYMSVEDWQQASTPNVNSRSQAASSPQLLLHHHSEPWNMIDMLSPVTDVIEPSLQMVSSELAQPTSPLHSSDSSNSEVADANRKAAARKNRILLRQKSASHQSRIIPTTSTCSHPVDVNGCSLVSPRALKKRYSSKMQRELFLICNHVQGPDMDALRFLLHKVLQPSDVNNLGRIVISKREAETHLPYLATKEGIFITMEDFDTAEQWTFRYRFWPNSRSRMYLFESTGGFVRAHHLKKGDILILWRNSSRGTFVIRGMEALPCWRTSNKQYIESG